MKKVYVILMFAACIAGCIFLVNAGDKYLDTTSVKNIPYECIDKQESTTWKGNLCLILIYKNGDEVSKHYVTTTEYYNTEIGDIKYYQESVKGHMTPKVWSNLIYSLISFITLAILVAKY